MILAANTFFPELNHLAAELARAGLLSQYVRPYANLRRSWERYIGNSPSLGNAYSRTLGRREMPAPLSRNEVQEAGIVADFLMAAHSRLPSWTFRYRRIRAWFAYARIDAVARKAAAAFKDERAVVASWGCAEPLFCKAKAQGALCVLNYPLAHHRFTRRYLMEEAARQPAFADTLNSHEHPPWYERRLDAEIELADRILLGSTFARDSFIAEGVASYKLSVVPYGADTTLFVPREPEERQPGPLRLLFVGQIGQRKGISYLLEAASRLASEGVSLTLVGQVQGNGDALNPYRSLFTHMGHVPRSELSRVYRQADIFVFPTLIEGMGLVVLEAMASGLPVITTAHGPGDIVRDGLDGFIVPPRSVDDIVVQIRRLKANPVLRSEMGRRAHVRAQEFTWAKYRQQVLDRIREWVLQ